MFAPFWTPTAAAPPEAKPGEYLPEMSCANRDTHVCWAATGPERDYTQSCQNTGVTSLGLCEVHDAEIRP